MADFDNFLSSQTEEDYKMSLSMINLYQTMGDDHVSHMPQSEEIT